MRTRKNRVSFGVLALLLAILIACQPGRSAPRPSPTAAGPALDAPPGTPAEIDGTLRPGEWQNALSIELSSETTLYLMHADGYLYLAVQGRQEPVTSICLHRGDTAAVLHSSAALGTAVYAQSGSEWTLQTGFTWSNRDTSDSATAQQARQAHLAAENWLASTGRMGAAGDVEYQIAAPAGLLRLALAQMGGPAYDRLETWPAGLADACGSRPLLQGPLPEQADLQPEQWMTVRLAPATD